MIRNIQTTHSAKGGAWNSLHTPYLPANRLHEPEKLNSVERHKERGRKNKSKKKSTQRKREIKKEHNNEETDRQRLNKKNYTQPQPGLE